MSGGIAALRLVREAGLGDLVRPGSEHAPGELGSQRLLPVRPELRPLFPGGGLRRGSVIAVATTGQPVRRSTGTSAGRSGLPSSRRALAVVAESVPGVHPGATSLLLSVLAEASKAGSWCAVVGVPTLGAGAAAEVGVVLERLALVPTPGPDWPTVVAALLDGFDIVVAAAPGEIAPTIASRLAARARQRGAVLMPYGAWPGVDLTLDAVDPAWHGTDAGRGRLRGRQLTVTARGRGAASAPRLTHLWLPQPSGLLPPNGELPPAGGEPLATVHRLPMTGRAAEEEAAGEKAAGEKAAGGKAAVGKAAGEKAAEERTAEGKAAGERAAGEKAAGEKTARGRTAREKAAEDPAGAADRPAVGDPRVGGGRPAVGDPRVGGGRRAGGEAG